MKSRMARWSALQTGKHGYPGSIPDKVKTFFRGINNLEQYIACRFEFNLNLKEIDFFFRLLMNCLNFEISSKVP